MDVVGGFHSLNQSSNVILYGVCNPNGAMDWIRILSMSVGMS